MIFTSIGLLVVALAFLIAGIVRSSVALLVLSLIATLVAAVLCWLSFVVYRRGALAAGGGARPAGWPRSYAGWAGAPGPVSGAAAADPAAPGGPTYGAVPVVGGIANGHRVVPVEGWDDLSVTEAARWVDTLNLDELHAVRRHEVEHANRKTVLRAIDVRIEAIVALRKASTGS